MFCSPSLVKILCVSLLETVFNMMSVIALFILCNVMYICCSVLM